MKQNKQNNRSQTNWANVLTWTRLILIAPITIAAFLDMRWTVFWLVIIGSLTDFFDGKIARWTGTANPRGALLDSKVDNLVVPFFFVWIWLLFPEVYRDFGWLLVLVGVSVVVHVALAKIYVGTFTGLHLWSNKLAAFFAALTLPLFILFGYLSWYVWVVFVVALISQLEGSAYLLKGGKNLDARFFWER